jgi:site-specific recombinase XerD
MTVLFVRDSLLQHNDEHEFAQIGQKGGLLVSSNFRSHIWQPAATNLLQNGLDMKTVTAVLGHENISTTLNHYAKTTQQSLINAAEALVAGVEGSNADCYGVSAS